MKLNKIREELSCLFIVTVFLFSVILGSLPAICADVFADDGKKTIYEDTFANNMPNPKAIFRWAAGQHSFADNQLYLSHDGSIWTNSAQTYLPDEWCEVNDDFIGYAFMADIAVTTRFNKACFVGARVNTKVQEAGNPNHVNTGFYVAFSNITTACVFNTASGTWANGICEITLPEDFSEMRTVIVEDDGEFLRYYMITSSGQKVLLLSADLSGEELFIYDGSESLVWSGPNNLINNKGGYFKLFNHMGEAVVDNVYIFGYESSAPGTETNPQTGTNVMELVYLSMSAVVCISIFVVFQRRKSGAMGC